MINKTFRLFISSTFSDFNIERTILNDKVSPFIDDFCQKQGYNFQLIDLRWGVNTEAALNQNTLAICLDEVKRCKVLSPKPNFLLMVGERYGWIPLPAKISKEDFNSVLSVANNDENILLNNWYEFDENEIGGEFFLKARSGKYINDTEWGNAEKTIYTTLVNCVSRTQNISNDFLNKIYSSATEQEILEGLLGNSDLCDNAIALLRNNYPDKDSNQSKIKNLRERIYIKFNEDHFEDNLIQLDFNDSYAEVFEKKIIEMLKANISSEIERLNEEQKKEEQDILSLREYFDDVTIERHEEYREICDYCNNNVNTPLFVIGDSGSGKSTLLAEYIKNNSDNTFFSFYGLNETSYSLIGALNKIANQIRRKYNLSNIIQIDYFNITEGLFDLIYSIPKDKSVTIIIDGLDAFEDISVIKEQVFPTSLPNHVKLIVSIANCEVEQYFVNKNTCTLKIEKISFEDSLKSIKLFLKQFNRQISSELQENIIRNAIGDGVIPLQLKLITNICTSWHSQEREVFLSENPNGVAIQYLTSMFDKFGHNKELVLSTLALITVSPYGITEEEIQNLSLKFPKVRDCFISEDRYNHNLVKLPFVIWSRLFYDLKGCLSLLKANGFIVVKFSHGIFYKAFLEKYSDYCSLARNVLIQYYLSQENYVVGTKKPNARKALMLAPLLRHNDNIYELTNLYQEPTFIDSIIKLGKVDELIVDIQQVVNLELDSSSNRYLSKLYNCLQNGREMLSYYYCEFYLCAMQNGLADNIAVVKPLAQEEYSIYFPYSLDSKIVCDEKTGKYCVYNGSYAYICDLSTHTELCRIYLQPINNAEKQSICKTIWLSNNLIAIISYEYGIYFYDITDNVPNLFGEFKCECDKKTRLEYSSKYNLLLVSTKKQIIAINIIDVSTKYIIPNNRDNVRFSINNNELVIKKKIAKLDVYDLSNGIFKKSIHIKSKFGYFEFFRYLNGYDMYIVNDDCYLECGNNPLHFRLYDTNNKSFCFIHPPLCMNENEYIVGKRYVLTVKENCLVAVDLLDNYKVGVYDLAGIKVAFWKKTDETLFVTTTNGLKEINLSDFVSMDGLVAVSGKKNLYASLKLSFKSMYSDLATIKKLFNLFNLINSKRIFEYQTLFNEHINYKDVDIFKDDITNASIVFKNDDFIIAVYEEKDTIVVLNSKNIPIICIDKLKFAVDNNLLSSIISKSGRYLVIWTNKFLTIIDLLSKEKILDKNIELKPINEIFFDESENYINIVLCNGKKYFFCLKSSALTPEMPNTIDVGKHDEYFGVYNVGIVDGETYVNNIFNMQGISDDFDLPQWQLNPKKWFRSKRMYFGQNHSLLYEDGEFYLYGDYQKKFSHEYYDFSKCKFIEQNKYSSLLQCYLKEKNDIFSSIYEFRNNYLILVSRMLNSIIVFDINRLTVVEAQKVNGSIIGCQLTNDNTIELILDEEPYIASYKVHI